MKNKTDEFIEPILIKAGDQRLGLGMSKQPPLIDCRVIADVNYQMLKKAYDKSKLTDRELLTKFAVFIAKNIASGTTPAYIVDQFYEQ